jgi:hypothetical protein
MSEFKNAFDAQLRLEELLTDNELGADHAYDLILNAPNDQKGLQWTIERLRGDIHETYRVFNAWSALNRDESGCGRAGEGNPDHHI